MKIGIIGSGIMGRGIAQLLATTGSIEVVWYGRNKNNHQDSYLQLKQTIERLSARKKLELEPQIYLSSINIIANLEGLSDCQLVIEAISENLNEKKTLVTKLDNILSKQAVIASNTSTLSINDISDSSNNPNRVVGMHFFNPAPVMPLVEFISLQHTDKNSLEISLKLIEMLHKKLVKVKDSPGFIVNHLLFPMINDAAKLLENGISDLEGIDSAMKLGAGHPMGPFKLADLVGLDITVAILEALHSQTGNDRYIPANIIKKLVENSNLGKKSGRGFYTY